MREIDAIVFADTIKLDAKKKKQEEKKKVNSSAYVHQQKPADKLSSVNISKSSINPYEEEESYENPVNISKAPGC